jgi:Lambda phage tail tube protein, TTP
MSGLEDPGDVSITGNYLPGDVTQIALFAIKSAGVAVPMKIVYPNSLGSASFSGLVLSMDISFPLDKECKLTIKAKASGPITIV